MSARLRCPAIAPRRPSAPGAAHARRRPLSTAHARINSKVRKTRGRKHERLAHLPILRPPAAFISDAKSTPATPRSPMSKNVNHRGCALDVLDVLPITGSIGRILWDDHDARHEKMPKNRTPRRAANPAGEPLHARIPKPPVQPYTERLFMAALGRPGGVMNRTSLAET